MKKILYTLIGLFLQAVMVGQSSSSLWQYVKIPTKVKDDVLNVNGLVVNDRGVILAVGYTKEIVDRNTAFPTRIYKMFRSKDNCKTWEDISKPELQSRLNKMDISPLENTEQYIDQVTAVGNRFYIDFSSGSTITGHQQDGHFYSDDDGSTWILANDDDIFRGNRTYFANDNVRIDLGYDVWSAKPVFSEVFKKNGSNWKLAYSPTNIIRTNETVVYEDKPPFLIFTGNRVKVFDVAENPNLGNFSFYFSNYTDPATNTLDATKFIACEKPETRKSGNWNCFYLGTALYTSKANEKVIYLINKYNWYESLYRSLDGGKNFSLVNNIPNIQSVFRIFPTCDDGTIIIGAIRELQNYKKITLLFKSSDNGNSWQELGEYPTNHRFAVVLKDGKYLIGGQDGLYLSKEVQCGSVPIPNPTKDYGTTIITHGYQANGDAPINNGEWAYEMAKQILKKINGKGCIKRYNKETGRFEVENKALCVTGENILLFDWAEESNNNSQGYSEAAGDALFSALLLAKKEKNITLDNLHFIGHSRGCVVNTECVERLLSIGEKVDHVTFLDPHDWGGGANLGLNVSNDWDNHPNLDIPFPSERRPNSGVIAWQGVNFIDNYWQSNPLYTLNLLDGRPLDGAANFDWNSYSTGHSNIHDIYANTINNNLPSQAGGYDYSRIGDEPNNRPSPNSPQPNKYSTNFDFYKSMIIPGSPNRVRGIMNGGFERGENGNLAVLPGWLYHGGSIKGESIVFKSGSIAITDAVGSTNSNPAIRHNRFYVPADAQSISLKYKRLKDDAGIIKIKIISQTQTNKFQINFK